MADEQPGSEIEAIYREVQRLYGVPYVSAIHESLATQPGFLEWAWHEVAPAFRTGEAQEAAWAAADHIQPPRLDPIPWQALQVWGLSADDVAAVRVAAQTFQRVAPVNMMLSALIALRLKGVAPSRNEAVSTSTIWEPPSSLQGTPPSMVDYERAEGTTRDLAMLFATERDGEPFVPGLYRMLLNWPGLAAHFGAVMVPRMRGQAEADDALRRCIDEAAPTILRPAFDEGPAFAAPSPTARAYFARISGTYRQTSPELVVASRLVLEALLAS